MLGWRRRVKQQSRPRAPRGLLVRPPGGYPQEQSVMGYSEQAQQYALSDLVYMCIHRLSQMAAQESLALYDPTSPRDPHTLLPTERIEEHPFLDLWLHPNPWDSRFAFMQKTIAYVLISGNGFWLMDDGGQPGQREGIPWYELESEPVNLWPIRPDRIKVQPDPVDYIKAYKYEAENGPTLHSPKNIAHFRDFHPLDDYMGMTPQLPARMSVRTDMAGQRSNFALFSNSMRLSMLFSSDKEAIDPAQVALMEKYYLERFTGHPDKQHQVAFMWEGFKPQPVGVTPRDAEFSEGTRINRLRVMAVMGVHPSIVLEAVNRASAEVGEYVTRKYTLAPLLELIASEITNRVLPAWGEELGPVEAHFPNVVPQNTELDAQIADMRASAVGKLVQALGPYDGVAEAQRWGLVSDEILSAVSPAPEAKGRKPFWWQNYP